MEGWIKLHRKIKDHWIWQDAEYLKMWIYLLLDVNHEDRKIIWNKDVIEIKRGEKITSLQKLAQEFNCSREKVRHFLNLLKKDTMITTVSNTNYTHIRVCNYDSYQVSQHTENTPRKQRENTGKTAGDTNKNEKNEKNEKNIIPPQKGWVIEYCEKRGNKVNVEKWFDHYEANGWMRGKTKIKDWQAAVRTWESSKDNGDLDEFHRSLSKAKHG